MFTSKAKKEKSKTFLSFLRRKKKGAREETSKEKKQGAKSKKCPSSIMETKERKVSRTQSIKTTITSTGSMCDESDTYSIYSIDVMAEASWMPAPESNEMTPQRHLDELLKERGYEKERYDCLKTGYYNSPTKLQIASYHAHLVSLVKQNNIEVIDDILACGLSPNPCNEFGSSLLQTACRRGNVELLEVMLRHGCSLQVADEFGRTPLHDALYAKQPAFAVVKRILQEDPHLINLADSRGHLAFDYVRKEHCDEWIAFLDEVADEIWPKQSEQPPPHPLTLRQANAEPLADPSNALSLDLAEAVASGKLRPCEALMLQNEDFSDIDDSFSKYDSSYSSSLGSISEGSEESFEDEELVKELALMQRRCTQTPSPLPSEYRWFRMARKSGAHLDAVCVCRHRRSLSLCVVWVVFYNKGMALEGEANNNNITDNHNLTPQENRRGRSGRGGRGRGRFGGRGGRGRAEKAIADENNPQDRPSGSSFNVETVKNDTNNHDTEQVKKNGSENTRGRVGGRGRGRSQTNDDNENTPASNHNNEDGSQEVYQGRGRGRQGRGRGREGRYGGRGRGRGRYEGRGRVAKEGKGSNDTDDDQGADSNIEDSATNNEMSHGDPPTAVIEATSEQQLSLETKGVTLMESTESNVSVASKPQIDTKNPAVLHIGNKATRKKGFPVVLARSNVEPSDPLQDLSEKLAQVAVEPSTKKTKKAKKKKEVVKEEDTDVGKDEQSPVDVTVALQRLPAQEVSITAATQVKMAQQQEAAIASVETKSTVDKKKKSKKQNPKMQDAKQAARAFNNAVRHAVERGDVQDTRDLLYDKRNHQFALDCNVLETAMKAFIMAALLEDALYCLRNCTLPDTLSVIQAERILQCLPQNLRHSSVFCAGDVIRSLCVVTQLGDKRTYFLRIVRAIALEFLEEATTARDRICSSPCERLVRQGLCIVNAKLERGKKPADLVVKPGDQLGVFIADENRGLQAGDAVSILPYAGPYPLSAESLDRDLIEAVVTSTNPMNLRLQDRTNAELYSSLTEPENLYRIDKLANRMGFNRQLAAVTSLCGNDQRVSPELVQAVTAMDANFMTPREATHLGRLTSTAALCATAVGDDDQDSLRAVSRLALEKFNSLEGLNASQQLAVEGAVTNRLTLVQGPPGTGKTAVAIRILQHWAKMDSDVPILATSDSNIAVDNLVEGCANVGLRVIRIGRPEAIRPELLKYCIDREKQANSVTFYKERSKQLRQAQVICCTCIGSGSEWLDAIGVCPRVLVDEATQATEPAVLVPLMRGCKQLVLVGDHCQLPPTVLSTQAAEEGHGVPLFSRMVACGVPPYMLDTQYRMHPAISQFPSDLFYGGLLQNGVSAPERRPLAGFPWPVPEFPVAFMPIYGQELDDGVSKYNVEEAQAAVQAVQMLLQGGQCTAADIAVVTPYAAQAKFIRRLIRQSIAEFLEVSSVDGFQGREKQAVVFSAVRSNNYGGVGFTSDWRRVNVSFTRARRALIVLGNDVCLRRGDPETWALWLAWADAAGINMDRPGQPRGRYDAEQLRRVRGGTTAAELLKDVLNRQREQIQSQLFHQERAVRNAQGQIMAMEEEKAPEEAQLTMEEEVALMENTDGNWDDSDDEAPPMPRNFSKSTLTSNSSISRSNTRSSTPTDAWDL